MSFSFSVTSASKSEARDLIAVEMAKVVQYQPSHAIDLSAVLQASEMYLNMIPDTTGRNITVNVNGSLSYGDSNNVRGSVIGCNFSITAYLM